MSDESTIPDRPRDGREPGSPTFAAKVGEYADALARGIGSPGAIAVRERYADNRDFAACADALDGIKRTLSDRPRDGREGAGGGAEDGLAALEKFARIAAGIPHNWPATCVLTFDEAPSGLRYLNYLKEDPNDISPTIADWRAMPGFHAEVASLRAQLAAAEGRAREGVARAIEAARDDRRVAWSLDTRYGFTCAAEVARGPAAPAAMTPAGDGGEETNPNGGANDNG